MTTPTAMKRISILLLVLLLSAFLAGSDSPIAAIVAAWQQRTAEALGEPIGYLAQTIPQRSPLMKRILAQNSTPEQPLDEAIRALGK